MTTSFAIKQGNTFPDFSTHVPTEEAGEEAPGSQHQWSQCWQEMSRWLTDECPEGGKRWRAVTERRVCAEIVVAKRLEMKQARGEARPVKVEDTGRDSLESWSKGLKVHERRPEPVKPVRPEALLPNVGERETLSPSVKQAVA